MRVDERSFSRGLLDDLANDGKEIGGLAVGIDPDQSQDDNYDGVDKATELRYYNIRNRAARIAAKICQDHVGKEVVFMPVETGGLRWWSDVTGCIDNSPSQLSDVLYGSINVKSYQKDKGWEPEMINGPSLSVENRDVILLEDIVDRGATLAFVKNYLLNHCSASGVEICTMLDRPSGRAPEFKDLKPDYVGFTVEGKDFLVGHGLDYNEHGRGLGDIYWIADTKETA